MTEPRAFLKFISVERNRKILSWIGGGLVVVIGGLFTWYSSLDDKKGKPSVEVNNAGTAAFINRGPVTNSTIITNGTRP